MADNEINFDSPDDDSDATMGSGSSSSVDDVPIVHVGSPYDNNDGYISAAGLNELRPRLAPRDQAGADIDNILRLENDQNGNSRWCTRADFMDPAVNETLHPARLESDGSIGYAYTTGPLPADVNCIPVDHLDAIIRNGLTPPDMPFANWQDMIRLTDWNGSSRWCTRRQYPDMVMFGDSNREGPMVPVFMHPARALRPPVNGGPPPPLPPPPPPPPPPPGPVLAPPPVVPVVAAPPAPVPPPAPPAATGRVTLQWANNDHEMRYVLWQLWDRQVPPISPNDRYRVFAQVFQAEIIAAGFTPINGFAAGLPRERFDSQAGMRSQARGPPAHWAYVMNPNPTDPAEIARKTALRNRITAARTLLVV